MGASVRITVDSSDVKGLMESDIDEMRDFGANVGSFLARNMAGIVAEKARQLLSTKDISASGKAAKNIFITRSSKSGNAYSVYEGSLTKANEMLRKGRKKTTMDHAPPVKDIVNWLVSKPGISFSAPERGTPFTTLTKKGGPRANLSSFSRRPYKVELKQVGAVIARHIAKEGMTSLTKKPPWGYPRFEYFSEAMRLSKSPLTRFASLHSGSIDKAVVEFIRQGNKNPKTLERIFKGRNLFRVV